MLQSVLASDAEESIRLAALGGLAPGSGVDTLLRVLAQDVSPAVRAAAATFLGDAAAAATHASIDVALLCRALGKAAQDMTSARARQEAVRALARWAPRAPPAELHQLCSKRRLQGSSARPKGSGAPDPRAVEDLAWHGALVHALEDGSVGVRLAAAAALGAACATQGTARDRGRGDAREAAAALLRDMFDDDSAAVRAAAFRARARGGVSLPLAAADVSAACRALSDGDATVRHASRALVATAPIATHAALKEVVKALAACAEGHAEDVPHILRTATAVGAAHPVLVAELPQPTSTTPTALLRSPPEWTVAAAVSGALSAPPRPRKTPEPPAEARRGSLAALLVPPLRPEDDRPQPAEVAALLVTPEAKRAASWVSLMTARALDRADDSTRVRNGAIASLLSAEQDAAAFEAARGGDYGRAASLLRRAAPHGAHEVRGAAAWVAALTTLQLSAAAAELLEAARGALPVLVGAAAIGLDEGAATGARASSEASMTPVPGTEVVLRCAVRVITLAAELVATMAGHSSDAVARIRAIASSARLALLACVAPSMAALRSACKCTGMKHRDAAARGAKDEADAASPTADEAGSLCCCKREQLRLRSACAAAVSAGFVGSAVASDKEALARLREHCDDGEAPADAVRAAAIGALEASWLPPRALFVGGTSEDTVDDAAVAAQSARLVAKRASLTRADGDGSPVPVAGDSVARFALSVAATPPRSVAVRVNGVGIARPAVLRVRPCGAGAAQPVEVVLPTLAVGAHCRLRLSAVEVFAWGGGAAAGGGCGVLGETMVLDPRGVPPGPAELACAAAVVVPLPQPDASLTVDAVVRAE